MAKHRSIALLKRWLRNTLKRVYAQFAQFVRHRLRSRYRRRRTSLKTSGFVLPTAIMLLLVMSLVVGAILLRTVTRTEQAILQRREKVIYNAATPAIDRAKAKLEYMFTQDERIPQGIPGEDLLTRIMLNQVENPDGSTPPDLYTFPDETRVTLNGQSANAWTFDAEDDNDGNGVPDLRIAYSIVWDTPDEDEGGINALAQQSDTAIAGRANRLQVRQGPYSGEPTLGCEPEDGTSRIENGWIRDPVSTAILLKNFQIDAFAIADNEDGTVTTLEVQQERQADRGNKWGAWFRNDLEVFPGPEFKWNGAMHTDGSLIVGHRAERMRTFGYLVSGPGSCLYRAGRSTSEISLDRSTDPETDELYEGQVVSGIVSINSPKGTSSFHLWAESDPTHHENEDPTNLETQLTPDTDSLLSGRSVIGITLDPIVLFTEDRSVYRNSSYSADNIRNNSFESSPFWERGRIFNESAARPYIDDFYRADDRYGPKPGYGGEDELRLKTLGVQTGEEITLHTDDLLRLSVDDDEDPKDIGLDGYWERRAWREGMRVIVGQRLELGNDPLAGTTDPAQIEQTKLTPSRLHESLQRRTLRDNPAAVQTTAIYHSSAGSTDTSEPPVAAIISTVHPGTAETLKRSAIFEQPETPFPVKPAYTTLFGDTFGDTPEELVVDFFTGRGTNGWQLDMAQFDVGSADVRDALNNLAQFSGDIDGAFPAEQEAGTIHPNPALTQWGNFSNLRRTLANDLGSFADWSNLHTAALTLGTLAYNVSYLDALDYTNINPSLLTDLADHLGQLRDGVIDTDNGEVGYYPTENLNRSVSPTTPESSVEFDTYNDSIGIVEEYTDGRPIAEDFNGNGSLDDIPTVIIFNDEGKAVVRMTPSPEAYIEALQYTDATSQEIELARTIFLKEQVYRDRKYGFRPSPTSASGFQYAISNPWSEDPTLDLDGTAPTEALNPGLDINGNGVWDYWLNDGTTNGSLTFSFGCNFNESNYLGLGAPGDAATEQRFLNLANNLCPVTPKFPALYYVFPIDDHGHKDVSVDLNDSGAVDTQDDQPGAEVEISDFAPLNDRGIMDLGNDLNNDGDNTDDEIWYIQDPYVTAENAGFTYKAFDATKLSNIVLKPLVSANWTLPYSNLGSTPTSACNNDAAADNPNPNCQQYSLVYDGVNNSYYRVAFKDTGLYDGRELQSVRALNMDVELLSDNASGQVNGTINGDTWLTGGDDSNALDGGILFTFREDALREDGIERPSGGTCSSASDIGGGCNTEVFNGASGIDPAVNPDNGISPKPVNFIPDPDRRAYGFRVINGEDISRPNRGGFSQFGLTLVSDNMTYVQGDFNCHKSPGGSCDNPIEEFNYTLSDKDDWGPIDFYDRRSNVNAQDSRFADPAADSWRYSEFLVDGLTILSNNFCDGSLEDPFLVIPSAGASMNPGTSLDTALRDLNRSNLGRLNEVYGCVQNPQQSITSYLGFTRPKGAINSNALWLRENPADSGSPIQISKNGNPRLATPGWSTPDPSEYDGSYFEIDEFGSDNARPVVVTNDEQYVNAIIISGIVPSREQQAYGGLHNFPRFIENWRNKKLFITGSFLQLNFSTSASAPYDQDGWEPNPTLDEAEYLRYYRPPFRRWGYDVALQLTRPGPVSSRLVTVGGTRSEYYTELPVDDPYINNLRCASGGGSRLDPRADCS
ncbi:MAG: hormogonium polysaccharide biosynthesis protein HpsA [Cyanobacteria bacterium SID2]|nr:hormogonium polysaccharide biosynthesis protein HpsA [Cyanobacteria bacterium SID2]MBP0005513.1 hormogonium polysaccharide biosynthesis protein HpsA [Cyanobacteria bacterium SBC]